MGIFKHIKDWRSSRNTSSKPLKPILLEVLEPRILLSGDGLLNIAAPEPFRDPLLDSMEQVVQYAELLEIDEQVEEQINPEPDPFDVLNTEVCRPIYTLFVDDDNANDESVDADLSVDNIGPAQVNGEIAVLSNDFDGDIGSKINTSEDESPQVYVNDAEISIEENTSIEIRGPPSREIGLDNTISPCLGSERPEVDHNILDEYAAEVQPDGTLDLPGMHLVDPTVDYFDGQTIYLDFDGEQNVTYDGPVVADGINIPEFSADAAGLAGQESAVISQTLSALEQEFEGAGVLFTTSKPDPGTSYSTVFVGGDGAEFREYGFFAGLAEKVDVGNQDPSDKAFVFSENVAGDYTDLGSFVTVLADVIAHETGHLLGYVHHIENGLDGPLRTMASVYYVDADATGANDGSSWANAHNYLQDALSVTLSGDEIRVAQGIYKPDQGVGITPGDRTATFQLINGVALYGGFAGGETSLDERDWVTNETILSGDIGTPVVNSDNSYHVVTGSETNATAMLDGFTITAGNTSSSYPHSSGAGMYNDNGDPMVTNCTFSGNSAVDGGGMFNYKGSNPTLTNCTFSRNSAMHGGGGMRNEYSSPTVTNCTFSGNSAGYAGAMYNEYSSPTLTDCTFSGNSANEGGGMYNTLYSNPTVTNCTFSGNAATYIHGAGGGMYNSWYSKPTVTNCTFSGNSAPWWGGGMYNYEGSPTVTNCTFIGNEAGMGGGMYNDRNSKPTVTNCTFSGNPADYGGGMCNDRYSKPTMTNSTFSGNSAMHGGGMYNDFYSSPTVTNCTFSGNSASWGGGMYNDFYSSATLANCILWGNTAPSGPQIYNDGTSSPTVTYSDIQDAWPGEGNIDVDPLFADPNNGEYHLKSEGGRWDPNSETWVMDDVTSPCIDRGDPAADYSREPSPNGHRINMGAYGNTLEASKSPFQPLSETSSAESALVETVMGQQAVLENVTVTGDFNSVLNFTNFDVVTIMTGPWAGKGFSKGQWQTILDGIPYQGDWKGVLFLRLDERKIYLKGAISGEIFATIEGYLSESVPESGVYDQYQATWKIGRLGATTISATLNLNGNLSYQSSSEFPATELYILQTNFEGTVSGDYAGPLSAVINHVRIVGGNNPYYGEGFSIISYVSGSGSGQGWTYDKLISPGTVALKGLFTSPLFGIVSGTLDESEQTRTLFLTVERVDLGLPPAPDPKVEIWGPQRVSPGQKISFVIELRNDGLAGGSNYSVVTKLPEYSKFTYAAEGYKFYSIADWDENDNYRPVPVVRRDISTLSAKTYLNLAAQTELFFGVTVPQRAEVYVLPKHKVVEIFPEYNLEGDKGEHAISNNGLLSSPEKPTFLMDWPAPGNFTVTSYFGEARKKEDGSPYEHQGLDIDLEIGDFVTAVADGKVVRAGWQNPFDHKEGYGLRIYIDHGGGIVTRSAHLDALLVTEGQEVKKGQIIAQGGNTGNVIPGDYPAANGSHLDFGVLVGGIGGTLVDPMVWLACWEGSLLDLHEYALIRSFTAHLDFTQARDPSIKYGPEGRVLPGERLDYKVEYENEGEGIAFGVYFTDTLDEDLDDSTLEIGPVIDVNDGSIIAEPGIYNPATRTITWFAGEVGPSEGGYAEFSANVRSDAEDGTEIINYATIYFPSVPEETRTNGIVSIVSLNQPPVVDGGPDETVDEGQLFSRVGSFVDDDVGDSWAATVDYGDGSGPQPLDLDGKTFTLSHTYEDDGIYPVTVTVTDSWAESDVGEFTVTVNNVAPTLILSGAPEVDENTVYVLSLCSSDPGDDTITSWTINWGDGAIETVAGNPSSVDHVYADGPNIYLISAQATDEDGTYSANTVEVTVHNVTPTITLTGPAGVEEGSAYVLTLGAVTDPGEDTVTEYIVHWGDGGTDTYSSGGDVTHVYADGPANHTIVVDLVDEDGTHPESATLDVQVTNVAPSLAGATFEVEENSPNGTVVGTISGSDPGDDTLTYSVLGGSGATAFAIDATTGRIIVADETQLDYETTPSFTLEVQVADDDNATDTATVTIDLLNQASITGIVFVDVNENEVYEANEPGIDGITIALLDENGVPVLDILGNPVTAMTSDGGFYLFKDLDPGTYLLHEVQPTGVDDGEEILGSLGGAIPANDTMRLTLERIDANDYIFAELGQPVASGDTATIGFWQNKHGQELIIQGGTALADWLTNNFGNVFGGTFIGGDGDDVASFYRDQLFRQKSEKSAGPAKVDAQFMAVALATYFTSSNLAGNVASNYGFNVTDTGIGTKLVNVGDNGTAFSVGNGTDLTIMQLLLATDDLTDQPDSLSGSARIYDLNGDGEIDGYEAVLRTLANDVFSSINEQGDI